jgi:peroxiredoxin
MMNTTVDTRVTPLPPGTKAPEFELRSTPDQTLSLAELRGRPVILAFARDRHLHFPLLADFEPKG